MGSHVGVDIESASAVDLPNAGLGLYAEHPTTIPLLVCVSDQTVHSNYDIRSGVEPPQFEKTGVTYWMHNASFDMSVLGGDWSEKHVVDSAVVARMLGLSSGLDRALKQLGSGSKLSNGFELIKLFSILPDTVTTREEAVAYVLNQAEIHPDEWVDFVNYCRRDAMLPLIFKQHIPLPMAHSAVNVESMRGRVTHKMNQSGWHIDVKLLDKFIEQSELNNDQILSDLEFLIGEPLNLNSTKQLSEFFAKRGVHATSFSEKAVPKLLKQINRRLQLNALSDKERNELRMLIDVLNAKVELGGSSVRKLTKLKGRLSEGDLLKHQYVHAGAAQTLRTTSIDVQVQNLKRLSEVKDVDGLLYRGERWSNSEIGASIRQVFNSRFDNGALVVADYNAMESRAAAYLANETWKLDAYKAGLDVYKLTGAAHYKTVYEDVTPEMRGFGKAAELRCQYQIGASTLIESAETLGIQLNRATSAQLVDTWRTLNPNIVQMWDQLDDLLRQTISDSSDFSGGEVVLKSGFRVRLSPAITFTSSAPSPLVLAARDAGINNVRSVILSLIDPSEMTVFHRMIHGLHMVGRDVSYFKPGSSKTGPLWVNTWTNPATKKKERFKMYGGKLMSIVTQSFCREIFMDAMVRADRHLVNDAVILCGQLHDELVFDVNLDTVNEHDLKRNIEHVMNTVGGYKPEMKASVQMSRRYLK